MYTRASHWCLSQARLIQSIPPHPVSLRFILILSSHLHIDLHSGLVPSEFPTKTLYAFSSPVHGTCDAYHIVLGLIILIVFGTEYKLWCSSLCSSLQPVISSLFSPCILLSTLFSNTLSLCSSLNVRDRFQTHTRL
jgi:hypothetical protein